MAGFLKKIDKITLRCYDIIAVTVYNAAFTVCRDRCIAVYKIFGVAKLWFDHIYSCLIDISEIYF